jgi:hypothetical protein
MVFAAGAEAIGSFAVEDVQAVMIVLSSTIERAVFKWFMVGIE